VKKTKYIKMYESLGRDVLLSLLDGVYTDYLTIWIKMVTPQKNIVL
jgi:hypothetical protein